MPDNLTKRVRVMIEPPDDTAETQVLNELDRIGATRIQQIAKGFVSAEVSIDDVSNLKSIARTGILPEKQLRKS
jgi:hypothetical protein